MVNTPIPNGYQRVFIVNDASLACREFMPVSNQNGVVNLLPAKTVVTV